MSQGGAGSVEDEERDLRHARGREWSQRARQHFLDAYIDALGPRDDRAVADHRVLLDAYVADKAVYEAVYEKRNRPTWTGIPLAALAAVGS